MALAYKAGRSVLRSGPRCHPQWPLTTAPGFLYLASVFRIIWKPSKGLFHSMEDGAHRSIPSLDPAGTLDTQTGARRCTMALAGKTPALAVPSPPAFTSLLAKPRAWVVPRIGRPGHGCPLSTSWALPHLSSVSFPRNRGWQPPPRSTECGAGGARNRKSLFQGHPIKLGAQTTPRFLNPSPNMPPEASVAGEPAPTARAGRGQGRSLCSWLLGPDSALHTQRACVH